MFIVFEGLDASGKSTQLELLRDRLTASGKNCILTGEPTDMRIGKLIRDILEHRETAHPQTVAALYAADRLEHLNRPETGILAQLEAGNVVIASRYYFSSLAYQSDAANMEWVASLNYQAKKTRPADLTIFLDLPPEVSMARITANRNQVELFDNIEKLTEVRKAFYRSFTFWGNSEENIRIIDASQSVEEVAAEIWQIVTEEMNK